MSEHESITLEELTDEELQLLVGLLMVAVNADKEYSLEEAGGLASIGARIGRERFTAAGNALRLRLPTQEDVLAALPSVDREPARVLIYQLVEEICEVDGLVEPERQLLEQIAAAWGLPARDSS